MTGQSTARTTVRSNDVETNASRSSAAARSPAAWPRPPPITGRCCCSRARRARPSGPRDGREDARAPAGAEVDPEHVADRHRPAGAGARRRSWSRRSSRTTTSRPALLGELDAMLGPEAILASTTSSLSVEELARGERAPGALRRPARVQPGDEDAARRADLPAARPSEQTRARALALCETFEKTPVEVPDVPGLRRQPPAVPVPVQRGAAARRDRHGRRATIDTCMRLGAGHPMGPLALLDLVGLDVSQGDRRDDRRAGARRASSSWSPRARSGARAGAGFTPTEAQRASRALTFGT